MKQILNAFLIMIVFTAVLGLAYPFIVMVIGQTAFHEQANGSLVVKNGEVVGSKLIQQQFTENKYFHGRPAKFGPEDYPSSKKMIKEIRERTAEFKKENNVKSPVPVCMVTDSGSSLDPDITPEAAYLQAQRVADARGISKEKVNELIKKNINKRVLGIFGEKTVNVLKLNMTLDNLK